MSADIGKSPEQQHLAASSSGFVRFSYLLSPLSLCTNTSIRYSSNDPSSPQGSVKKKRCLNISSLPNRWHRLQLLSMHHWNTAHSSELLAFAQVSVWLATEISLSSPFVDLVRSFIWKLPVNNLDYHINNVNTLVKMRCCHQTISLHLSQWRMLEGTKGVSIWMFYLHWLSCDFESFL